MGGFESQWEKVRFKAVKIRKPLKCFGVRESEKVIMSENLPNFRVMNN